MSLTLLDWRRRVAQLYADVRAAPDPAAAHVHWVEERRRLFAEHPDAPAPAPHPVAPYDPAWRALAEVRESAPETRTVATGTDGDVTFERVGVAVTPWGELDLWWLRQYGGGLWLPVRDPGAASYGGGRYLLDTVKGADLGSVDDRLVVDLNFLYDPSCAYDEAWACPLAPPGNVLPVEVPVGELAHAPASPS